MTRHPPDAILMVSDVLTTLNRKRVIDFAAQHKLPAIFEYDFLVREGGLMSYGPDVREMYDRAAGLAVRILKGADPAQLPLEEPSRFVLAINLGTAKAIGLTLPPSLLARADDVIEYRSLGFVLAGDDVAFEAAGAAGQPARRRLRMGLAPKLVLAFIGLASFVLVVNGSIDLWLAYREAENAAIRMEQEDAGNAAQRIAHVVDDVEEQLGWTTPPGWDALALEQRRYDFIRLLREVPAISEADRDQRVGKGDAEGVAARPRCRGERRRRRGPAALRRRGGQRRLVQPDLFPQPLRALYDDRGRACRP